MKKIIPVISVLFLFACKTTHSHSGTARNKVSTRSTGDASGVCDRSVTYFADKVVAVKTGEVTEIKVQISVDPSAKTINILAHQPGEEEVNFNTVIERSECHMNPTLTEGYIAYSGYIVQKDGSSTKALVRLECRDGALIFTNGDPEKPAEMDIYISRWEFKKQ